VDRRSVETFPNAWDCSAALLSSQNAAIELLDYVTDTECVASLMMLVVRLPMPVSVSFPGMATQKFGSVLTGAVEYEEPHCSPKSFR